MDFKRDWQEICKNVASWLWTFMRTLFSVSLYFLNFCKEHIIQKSLKMKCMSVGQQKENDNLVLPMNLLIETMSFFT